MKIGVTIGLGARGERTVDGLIARGQQLEALGFASVWMPNAFGFDAVGVLGAIGRATERIEVGTAVIPTFPRHPVMLAQQALTAQALARGRFTLGVGLSHKSMMEDSLGIPYQHPARHMREYLAVLAPLLQGEPADFRGDEYRVAASLAVADAPPVPLLVAALGPAMLRLTGALADGTITSWVGPRTLESYLVPALRAAAAEAGRPAPRIVAGMSIALTGAAEAEAARQQLAQQVAWYNDLPSYRAMLDREGVDGPADVALIGDERTLDAALEQLAAAGVTDLSAHLFSTGPGSTERTLEYLASKARERVA